MQRTDPGNSSFPASTEGLHTGAGAGTWSRAAVPRGRAEGRRRGEREQERLWRGWDAEGAQSRDRWWRQALAGAGAGRCASSILWRYAGVRGRDTVSLCRGPGTRATPRWITRGLWGAGRVGTLASREQIVENPRLSLTMLGSRGFLRLP